MKKISLASLILALGFTVLSACGGDSGSAPLPSPPTKAVIKIETAGTLDQGVMIGGITVTGVLPAGVTVKATPDAQNPAFLVTDSDVVIASGVTGTNASAYATYNATNRKVNILVYGQEGFGIGEFVTVTCDIAPGTRPTAGSFGLEGFISKDLNGSPIGTLTAGFTVSIQ